MHFSSRSFLSLSLIAAFAPVARAELAADSAVTLDGYQVVETRAAPLTIPGLADLQQQLVLTPGGAEAFSADRYLRGRASTVDDTFALSPGVIAQSRFGSDEARLSIRGSGLQRTFHGRGLRLLQDGVPLNLADGSFDMQALEPLSAAHVAVWRGAAAPAHGATTLGGAIDYITRNGRDAAPFSLRLEAGSWDYWRAGLSGGGTAGRLDAFATFTAQGQDGFRDHARQLNRRAFANLGVRWSDAVETRFYVTAVRTDSELPGNLTRAQLETNPRQAAAGNLALDQRRDFDLLRVASRTSGVAGDTRWDVVAAWSYKDLDHPIHEVIDQLANDLVLGAHVIHSATLAGRAHRLHAGVQFQRGTIESANFANLGGRRGALVAAAQQTAANIEAHLEDQIALGSGFTLVLGGAAAHSSREHERRLGATPSYKFEYNRVLPRAALRWEARDVQVYAAIGDSFEPPSFSEALTLLAPRHAQHARTLEVGSRGTRGALRWDVSLYRSAVHGELLSLDHDQNPSTPAATINADRTLHQGVELGFDLDLLGQAWSAPRPDHRLVLRAAWTWGRFTFDDDPLYGSNTLPGLPPHLIRGELTWENAAGWYAGPTFTLSPSKTYIDFRNTFAADAYAIAGFRLGRRQPSGFSWFVEVRNVTDRRYAATTGVIENAAGTDQPQFLPGEGRGFFLGTDFRW